MLLASRERDKEVSDEEAEVLNQLSDSQLLMCESSWDKYICYCYCWEIVAVTLMPNNYKQSVERRLFCSWTRTERPVTLGIRQ